VVGFIDGNAEKAETKMKKMDWSFQSSFPLKVEWEGRKKDWLT
jgi:hypothetical protein